MKHQPFLRSIFLVLFFGIAISAYAQVANDECRFGKAIQVASNYCSADGEFTNVGATADPEFPNTCVSLKWDNGVWFSFVPREPAALIRVFGSGNGGTLKDPKIIIFEKCGDYLQCSPGKTVGLDELTIDDLNIGQTYFIMIESSIGGNGTFKLCIDDFIPTASPESDCKDGVVLCDKSSFKVESLSGAGTVTNELDLKSCVMEEFASAWYKWTCDVSGTLTFTLTPNDFRGRNFESDDLDFAIYELPNGIDNCSGKEIIRCMAAGANSGANGGAAPLSQWIECNGETGLRDGDGDVEEDAGCRENGDDNWLSPLNMVSGKSYVLIVNNFSRSGLGFAIDFGGSGTFLGPKVDFGITAQQKFECDKTVTFTNNSSSATDSIVKYSWNFGARSTPSRSSVQGPLDVVYSGFGDKTAALTIESSRGCVVTKIIDFYVDACCKDTSTLGVNAKGIDTRCFGLLEGRIEAQGFSGSGDYQYSIDGKNFQPNPNFVDLRPGVYNIIVYDLKGCRDTLFDVPILEPLPIIVDAGPDQELELGETTFMAGSFTSTSNGLDSMFWEPSTDFEINGITNPEVFPKNNTTYTFTVTDENGCTKSDQVTIRVTKSYKLEAPNIFTPKGKADSPSNDFFNVFVNKGVKYVELLEVYDRWGNLVYQDRDIKLDANPGELVTSSQANGWDGNFKSKKNEPGQPVSPGVYAWRAKVRFIDDVVKEYSGDITVLR